MNFKNFFIQLFLDKDSKFSLREFTAFVYMLLTIIAWVGVQFFGQAVPQYMFYSFMSMIGASAFGYSLERRSNLP